MDFANFSVKKLKKPQRKKAAIKTTRIREGSKAHQPASLPFWQAAQEKKRQKLWLSFIKIFLVVSSVLAFIYLFFIISSIFKKNTWEAGSNYNLVLSTPEGIYILSFHPDNNLDILKLPANTYIDLVQGYGSYPVSSLWRLGEIKSGVGGPFVADAVQFFLGAPINGWARISFSSSSEWSKNDLYKMLCRMLLAGEKNLTNMDIASMLTRVTKTAPFQINWLPFEKSQAGQLVVLADGSEVFQVRQEYLDMLVDEYFKDDQVIKENVIWSVFNKSETSGLAAKSARVIVNIGGDVVWQADSGLDYAAGVYCQTEKICDWYTLKLVASTFGLPIISQDLGQAGEAVLIID